MESLLQVLTTSIESMPLVAYPVSFAAGILVSFTPCVYPLIPIIAGYIGGRAQGSRRRSLVLSLSYVVGVAVTYCVLGAIASMTGKVFGQVQANPIANIVLANIIILFGLSMLGVFVLPVPSFRKSGKQKKKGNVVEAIGMGMASGVIAAPCTAPVAGAILAYVAAGQNVLFGISLLFTFALGLGAILVIAGTFAGILASLPKSGVWMQRVEKTLGYLMILLGEYFLVRAGRLMF